MAEPASDPRVQALADLLAVVDRFRRRDGASDGGCAWYEAQTGASLIPYLQEETAELVEAIERGSAADRREELGDVLFQVLFHADIAASAGEFDLGDVADDQAEKLRRRNPHVFGDRPTRDIGEIIEMWQQAKAIEKRDRRSVLDGISFGMPALALAAKVLGRAEPPTTTPATATPTTTTPGTATPTTATPITATPITATPDAAATDAGPAGAGHRPETAFTQLESEAELGDALLAAVVSARASGWDAERAVRDAVFRLAGRIRAAEQADGETPRRPGTAESPRPRL